MAKKKPTPRPADPPSPSFVVLAIARKLIEDKKCTLKDLAARVEMPATSLAAMLDTGYKNMTLSRIDALKAAVREIRTS